MATSNKNGKNGKNVAKGRELSPTQKRNLKSIVATVQGAFNTMHAGLSADGTCMCALHQAFVQKIPCTMVVHEALDSLPEKGTPGTMKVRKAKLLSIANAVDKGTMVPVGKDKTPTAVGGLLVRADGSGASLQGLYSAIKATTSPKKGAQQKVDELVERIAKQLANDDVIAELFLTEDLVDVLTAATNNIKGEKKAK